MFLITILVMMNLKRGMEHWSSLTLTTCPINHWVCPATPQVMKIPAYLSLLTIYTHSVECKPDVSFDGPHWDDQPTGLQQVWQARVGR